MFLLVDGNNFYVSCERLYRPDLNNKPVVVLSNNDGCIVARSNEVKALGIKMGEPLFKCKHIIDRYRVTVFSSNYALYADLSNRIVTILKRFTPDIEVYSIDESFLVINMCSGSYYELGRTIKETVLQEVGIPVGVGIGKTKTLAKVANKLAKTTPEGVFNIHEYDENKLLRTVPVSDLWGIGKGFTKRLSSILIHNAYQFKIAAPALIRKRLHVWGERMQLELQGISCMPLEVATKPNKSIISSKSFGKKITDCHLLEGAIAANVIKATEKCRKQQLKVKEITVFLISDRFRDQHYYHAMDIQLPTYSSATGYVTYFVINAIKKLYRCGVVYTKSGVICNNLCHEQQVQTELRLQPTTISDAMSHFSQDKLDKAMKAYDAINQKWGSGKIELATTQVKDKPWKMNQQQKSKHLTTQWCSILKVK
ncbi:SOS mutagenesis and repair protein UmuC [Candidatus Marinamargulisbacteria bacterium SCGC AG-414-C22]|nr:SOS mutagenesis and repair protein UmuC [Candidatus Marinamargulisbacteria bacterium SCGC AG-414-C22]